MHHKRIFGTIFLISAFAFVGLHAQQTRPEGQYPAPRYPDIKKRSTPEELLNIARAVVKKPSNRDQLRPGYDIKKGERVLIAVDSDFERPVLDAIVTAIQEAGGSVDVLLTQTSARRGLEGWKEVAPALAARGSGPAAPSQRALAMKLASEFKYDLLIQGSGGPAPNTAHRWEYIPWSTVAKFVTGAADFPVEVQEAIDQKVWATLLKAKRVRVTDPEGTDITWTLKPEYFELLKTEWPGYGDDVVMKGHISLTPLFTAPGLDAKGVIAGTLNHAGTFPAMKLFLEDGKVVRVEGGGRTGELWKEYLTKFANVHVPSFPGPGSGWLIEVAFATNPKVARPPQSQVNYDTWERLRSGVIHFGLGLTKAPDAATRPEYDKYLKEHNVPSSHFHVHTYFNTVEVETTDGKTVKLADKGHLTVLDDPEVRKVAAKYGDPDQLLREEWIPGIPGINAPGDYNRDYAPAPEVYLQKELEQHYGKP
ncbi:MAG: hypothetical protein HY645_14670 [Acidobacteria bacterium]|nr:hypothetical protein [Acidobacteriota bacterium]